METTIPTMTVGQLSTKLQSGENFCLLDVRELFELQISALPGILSIPMDDVPKRLQDLPKDETIVVVCRTGNRSGAVTRYLNSLGYDRAVNLEGGMNAWAKNIDPTMPTY